MKSGYWTREFIAGLFHLITPYWNSEEKKSARLYLAGIITLTIAAVYMTLLLNEWFNSFYSALQNYDSDAVYSGLLRHRLCGIQLLPAAAPGAPLAEMDDEKLSCQMDRTANVLPS